MASNVFNGRNELSTLRRCLSDTYLGFKRIGQASLSAEAHTTFLHLLSCPDPGVGDGGS